MKRLLVGTTTYFPPGEDGELRSDTAREVLKTWFSLLAYPGGSRRLLIADDGSYREHFDRLLFDLAGWDFNYTRQERQGVGASMNKIVEYLDEEQPLLFFAPDDWMLHQYLDLKPWTDVLHNREDIGMIRLGPAHPDLSGRVQHVGEFGLLLDRHHYAFGHRPALYHKRFFEAYGRFDERCSVWDSERLYNERFCAMSGPDIMLALLNPWAHSSPLELGTIEEPAWSR